MKRLLAISDIHGHKQEFKKLLKKAKFTKEDKLILLGDYVDRGPENMNTVLYIKDLKEQGYNIVTLLGNHDDMFLKVTKEINTFEDINSLYYAQTLINNQSIVSLKEFFNLNKQKKMNSIQKEIIREIKSYKRFHIESDYLFVHAGVKPGIPLEDQRTHDLLWIRDEFIYNEHDLPYTVVFGHTPTKYMGTLDIWKDDKKIGIDCGLFAGGKLACIDLTNDIEYYVSKFDCNTKSLKL